jgi:hypothetical protein
MPEEEPHLRVVGERTEPTASRPGTEPPARRERWITVVLVLALTVTIALLAWTRTRMGAQISDLESQVRRLEGVVAERNRVIDAHERRLDDVRDRVDDLRLLLEQPVSPAR